MQPSDLEHLVRRVVREELQVLASILQPSRLTPCQVRLVQLLAGVFGSEAFTTRDLIRSLEVHIGVRPQLRDALVDLAGVGLPANKVGLALSSVVEAGGRAGALRLCSPAKEGGSRVWMVEGT